MFETDERNSYFLAHIDIHPAFKGADVHQDGPQGDTQGDTQEIILDKWIEGQIRNNPAITTEELAKLSRKGVATIKRHISKLPHIKYVGGGYSGHWEVDMFSDSCLDDGGNGYRGVAAYFAYKHFTVVLHNREEHPHGDVGVLARDAACGILHNMADAVNAPLEGAERSNTILRGRGCPRPRVNAR